MLPAFDRVSAIERLGGDEELFSEVAGVFLGDAPKLMAVIRGAVVTGDALAGASAPHTG